MSVEELYLLPDDELHHELAGGWLVSEPPAGFRHGRVTAVLVERLGAFVREHRLGAVVAGQAGFVLRRGPDTVRAPDVAFVRSEPLTDMDDSQARPIGAGTAMVWLVDPEQRAVTCYRAAREPETFREQDTLSTDDLLPGLRLPVAEIFPA